MLLTIFLFLHLVATCAAIGTIFIADLRLVAKLMDYRVVIPTPQRFETIMITFSLVLLYLTGGVLIAVGLGSDPLYLDNAKLQGKLLLVAVLTANAFVLHFVLFPLLRRGEPVATWSHGRMLLVSATVSLSSSLWLYCAFLGVARIWNFSVSLPFVLAVALGAWAVGFVMVRATLALASREAPKPERDWVDSTIARISDFARIAADRHPGSSKGRARSANEHDFGRRLADRRVSGPSDRRSGR